jgi:hypothetical protein
MFWHSITSSSDGNKLAAVTSGGQLANGTWYYDGSIWTTMYVTPPRCVSPGGHQLKYNGTNWTCECVAGWIGSSCETFYLNTSVALPYSPWCKMKSVYVPTLFSLVALGGVDCTDLNADFASNDGNYDTYVALLNFSDFTWTRLANMSVGRMDPAVMVNDNKLYVIGGRTETSSNSEYVTASAEVYDFTTNAWQSAPSLPEPRILPACAFMPGTSEALCAGGYRPGIGYSSAFRKETWKINLADPVPSWSSAPSLNTKGVYFDLAGYDGKFFAPGGYYITTTLDSFESLEFTGGAASWQNGVMNEARMSASVAVANDEIFIFGGVSAGAGTAARAWVTTYLRYAVSTDSWQTIDHSDIIDLGIGERSGSGTTRFRRCEKSAESCGDSIWYVPGSGIQFFMPFNESHAQLQTVVTDVTCDASMAPSNGGVGDCTKLLAHGSSCTPTCDDGYTLDAATNCSSGVLTASTCASSLCTSSSSSPCTSSTGPCVNRAADYPKTATEWDYLSVPPAVSGVTQVNAGSWSDINQVCVDRGLQLCQSGDFCTDQVPPSGIDIPEHDSWIAVGDSENEWLTFRSDRTCKTHTEVTGAKPSWGTSSLNYTYGGWYHAGICCGNCSSA